MNPDRKRRKADYIWWLFRSKLISSTAAIAYIAYLYDDDDFGGGGGHIGEQLGVPPSLETVSEVAALLVILTWVTYAWSRSRQEEAA